MLRQSLDRLHAWFEAQLRGGSGGGRVRRTLLGATRLTVLVQRRFRGDLCLERAASLAFSTVIAAIPAAMLILLSAQLIRGVESDTDLLGPAIAIVSEYVPETDRAELREALREIADSLRVEDQLRSILRDASQQAGPVTALAVLILVLSAMTVFRSAERAFTGIWRVKQRRGIFEKVATFWLLLTAAPAILGVSAYVKAQLMRGLVGDSGVALHPVADFFRTFFLDGLFPLSISFFAFLLLSTYLPNTRVRLSAAAGGALTSAIGWELGTRAFQLYVESTMLSGLLGALGVVPFFLLWVYFSWCLVLVGAETSYCLQHYTTLVAEAWGKRRERTIARPTLALLLLERIYLSFRRRDPLETLDEVSRRLGVAIGEIEEVVTALEQADLIVTHEKGWLPARAADHLRPQEVIELFPTRAGFQIPTALEGVESPLLDLLREVDTQVSSSLSRASFADLLPPAPPEPVPETP